MGGAYMWEKYKQIDDADIGLQKASFTFNKYQLRFKADYLAINEHFEFMKGFHPPYSQKLFKRQGIQKPVFLKSQMN